MFKINPDINCSYDSGLAELERLSTRVVDLIRERRFDDAERVCNQLKRKYPEVIDWIEHTGAVHEARGEVIQAIQHYRRCLDYIDDRPDGFDEESKDWYRSAIKRLEARRKQ